MILKRLRQFVFVAAVITAVSTIWQVDAYAKSSSVNVSGNLYEFEGKADYEYSSNSLLEKITEKGKLGTFSISGDIKEIDDVKGYKAYQVQHTDVSDRTGDEGIVLLSYVLGSGLMRTDETEWHIVSDNTTKVDQLELDAKVQSGTIILQTSLDGNNWVTDVVKQNIAGEESSYASTFYKTKGIQQVNGCFYRVIVVYKTERRLADTKSLGFIPTKNYEDKKYAEIYEFYLIDSLENSDKATSPTATPLKELGKKINTGKDNGYSGNEAITNKDPHFGISRIGTFYLNGYTREQPVKENETPIFLKTLGDRVTLWFKLEVDINDLDGKGNLSIAEDTNGYDQQFGIPKTNFKHGALIIQFTDSNGHPHDPVIYTDYLAACATTGANTKVELFEEGDYEVALDYEIRDNTFIDSYTNYRISFKFKIRNGNCMVYPFDVGTGAELSDNAVTENGFRLDLAKSRYLTIDIVRCAVKKVNDKYSLDTRVSTATQENKTYTDEGIYTFTVKNPSTGDSTTKTIYVGNNPIYKALAGGKTIEAINELIDQGGILQVDGSILIPIPEPTQPDEPEEQDQPEQGMQNENNDSSDGENHKTEDKSSDKQSDSDIVRQNENASEKKTTGGKLEASSGKQSNMNITIYVVIGLIIAAITILLCTLANKKKGITVDEKELVNTDNTEDE